MTEIIKKNGRRYATIEGVEYRLMRIYECSDCGAKAEAGSEELLNEWKKVIIVNGLRATDHLHYCMKCAGEKGI